MDKLNYIAENKLPKKVVTSRREPLILNTVQMIIDEHSGGMKFTELLNELIAQSFSNGVVGAAFTGLTKDDFPSVVEMTIRDFGQNIKILDYTWTSMNRAKMFVYTEK
jgi:hypothetical protein